MRSKEMVIAEAVKLFIGLIFSIDDEGLAQILDYSGNFGFETLPKKLAAHIFEPIVSR